MNIINLNSTPLWQTDFADFAQYKDEFLSIVEEYIQENPEGDSISNIGGYQSPKLLHQKQGMNPLLEVISSMSHRACLDLNIKDIVIAITETWVNVNKRGAMNVEHAHGDILSGVFYLKLPKDENKGSLYFRNKNVVPSWDAYNLIGRGDRNEFTAEVVKMNPEEGQIIIFPSHVMHGVQPHFSDDDRISISFNITAIPKEHMKQNPEESN